LQAKKKNIYRKALNLKRQKTKQNKTKQKNYIEITSYPRKNVRKQTTNGGEDVQKKECLYTVSESIN
jgi:hypothetical protein